MAVPTTAALSEGTLLLVNAQFEQLNSGGPVFPVLPFSVMRVAAP